MSNFLFFFFYIQFVYINNRSMLRLSVSICDFNCEPSFCKIEHAMTGRETPQALPNPSRFKIIIKICSKFLTAR